MSDTNDAAAAPPHEPPTEADGPTGHDAHGHDPHGHDEEPLGPPDVGLWAAGIGGIAVAIVIAACFAFSTGAL